MSCGRTPPGWLCTRTHTTGPCALRPRWWNFLGRRYG